MPWAVFRPFLDLLGPPQQGRHHEAPFVPQRPGTVQGAVYEVAAQWCFSPVQYHVYKSPHDDS